MVVECGQTRGQAAGGRGGEGMDGAEEGGGCVWMREGSVYGVYRVYGASGACGVYGALGVWGARGWCRVWGVECGVCVDLWICRFVGLSVCRLRRRGEVSIVEG